MCDFCPLCFSPSEEAVELDECGHEFCRDCIEVYLSDAVERRKSTVVRCPMGDCDELVEIDELRCWAKSSTLEVFDTLMKQRISRLRCGVCKTKLTEISDKDGLRAVLEGRDIWLSCPTCGRQLCSQCGAPKYDMITSRLHDTDDCEYDSGSDADFDPLSIHRIDDCDERTFLEEADMLLYGPHSLPVSRRSSVDSNASEFSSEPVRFTTEVEKASKPASGIFQLMASQQQDEPLTQAQQEQEQEQKEQEQEEEEKQKVTRCPVCGHCVWREDGCAHIVCVCEHEFCFYCRKPWDFRGSEKQHWHRRRCPVRRHNDSHIQCRFPCDCHEP